MKFILFAILDLAFTLVCYLTNPVVVLTCDEYGNLPHALRWWQTWDNTCDVEWMVTEGHVPGFLRYDYGKHYVYHPEDHDTGAIGYVDIIDPDFSFVEKLQRYGCRVCWLYRNTGYGFSYEVTGVDVYKADIIKIKTSDTDGYTYYVTDYAWVYKDKRPSFGGRHWDNFLGWKMQDVSQEKERCMLACRITPFKR